MKHLNCLIPDDIKQITYRGFTNNGRSNISRIDLLPFLNSDIDIINKNKGLLSIGFSFTSNKILNAEVFQNQILAEILKINPNVIIYKYNNQLPNVYKIEYCSTMIILSNNINSVEQNKQE